MINPEKEYQEFMIKLINKAKEVHDDFKKLSYENKKRVEQNIDYFAVVELLKSIERGNK